MTLFLVFVISILSTEFIGYILHRLLHNERIEFLSRGHMIHHLKLYGPKDDQRSQEYRSATDGRFGVGRLGIEWVLPTLLILGSLLGFFWLLEISLSAQIVFIATAIIWGLVMLNYMHDSMHMENFWMLNNSYLRDWFLEARRLHDIHHKTIDDNGLMNKNFGISFFWIDRLFGTFTKKEVPFNSLGYQQAVKRYAYIYKEHND